MCVGVCVWGGRGGGGGGGGRTVEYGSSHMHGGFMPYVARALNYKGYTICRIQGGSWILRGTGVKYIETSLWILSVRVFTYLGRPFSIVCDFPHAYCIRCMVLSLATLALMYTNKIPLNMAVGTAWAKGQLPHHYLYSPSSKVKRLAAWQLSNWYNGNLSMGFLVKGL